MAFCCSSWNFSDSKVSQTSFIAALNASQVCVASNIPIASVFQTTTLSILTNQYFQKYCSRSLSNKEPLYISVQKHGVTEHNLCWPVFHRRSLPPVFPQGVGTATRRLGIVRITMYSCLKKSVSRLGYTTRRLPSADDIKYTIFCHNLLGCSPVRLGSPIFFLPFYQNKFSLPLRPVLFFIIELIAAGGIVVLPSGRIIGVTVTSSHSMGT